MLFSSPLHSLEFRQIEEFCRTWPEGVRVEYKRELAARHIPKVVSSFANTVGGVWIIGVATNVDNCPVFPIRGFPRESGIEERITQACYQNLYPPLLPEIKIIDVPGAGGNVVAVVQILESVEAPHAIENSTKVYIRTNSTTEIIQLAEIDRIEYLLKRRQEPEQKREKLIEDMRGRSCVGPPSIRIIVSPRYPWRSILGKDVLLARLNELSHPGTYVNLRHFIRLVRGGFMSEEVHPLVDQAAYHFEVNLHGIISCYVTLGMDGPRVFLDQIVNEIGRALNLARYLLKGTQANILVRVQLHGVKDSMIIASGWQGNLRSVEEVVQAEDNLILESLDDALLFPDHVAELVRQLMWSFNVSNREVITQATREILTRHRLP
jgi:Schlafen, AlbA_2